MRTLRVQIAQPLCVMYPQRQQLHKRMRSVLSQLDRPRHARHAKTNHRVLAWQRLPEGQLAGRRPGGQVGGLTIVVRPLSLGFSLKVGRALAGGARVGGHSCLSLWILEPIQRSTDNPT